MNKLSITITLTIALIILICLFFNAAKSRDYYIDGCLANTDLLVKTNLAIESTGLMLELQEDGSFKLVERITE